MAPTTPAWVPAAPSEETADEPPYCVGAPSAVIRPIRFPTVLRAGRAPGPKPWRGAKGTLDEAIASAVAAEDPSPHAPGETQPAGAQPSPSPDAARSGQVTLTSATVPRAVTQEPAASPARLGFVNHLSDAYRLERLRFLVDGAVAYDAATPGTVEIAPGEHLVEVIADYRLHDPLLSYMRDYHLAIESTEILPASREPVSFVASAIPKGGVTTPMDRAVALTWRSSALRR